MPFQNSSDHEGYQTCQQSFPGRLPPEADASSLLRIQIREMRHGEIHKVPVVLRGYQKDQLSNLKPGAPIILHSLHHPRHKPAVLDLAFILERLPCGRQKKHGVDGRSSTLYDVPDTTHCKLSRRRFLFRHVDQGDRRSVCPGVRDSNRPERLVNRRIIAVCESRVRIRRIGRVRITLQTRVL